MIVAVDTGGTKTLVTSFDKKGAMGDQVKFDTPQKPSEYVEQLQETLIKLYGDKTVEAIVIAAPGVIKKDVFVLSPNLPAWIGFNIRSEMAGVLGKAPVFIENDANLAGLGETRQLSKTPVQSLYITISTGIGSGIITNGHIDEALRYSEAGHTLIEFDGVVREWEKFASGKAIYNAYGKYARDISNKRIWNQIADRISRGFLAVIPILQPDIIIIGGSIGTYFERYGAQLQNLLKEKLPPHIDCPKNRSGKTPRISRHLRMLLLCPRQPR